MSPRSPVAAFLAAGAPTATYSEPPDDELTQNQMDALNSIFGFLRVVAERKKLKRCASQEFAAAVEIQSRARVLLARWQRKALERIRHRLPELRQDYLNTIACKAGTNQNEWYSDENILLREALREHPRVQEAIAHAWNACSQGKQRIDRSTTSP